MRGYTRGERLFTWHSHPLSLRLLSQASQFIKLCRDCQVMGSTLSEASPPLGEADVQVTFTAEVKRTAKPLSQGQKMDYHDFLTALMKLSVKVYPSARSVDEAFQRLLMENVLPLASRRSPDRVDMFLENEDVQVRVHVGGARGERSAAAPTAAPPRPPPAAPL